MRLRATARCDWGYVWIEMPRTPGALVLREPNRRRRWGEVHTDTRKVSLETPVGRVMFERCGKWWAIALPSFPGGSTQGKTKAYRCQ
jgi:hypothetical protein